jgi:hypothetical protein
MSAISPATNPAVLSYLMLRRAVGWIALLLPFALFLLWLPFRHGPPPSSISGYYYTGMRNLFEGCMVAIGMFNLCCRGYDRRDEVAGIFSALCALGVAFCPTSPEANWTPVQFIVGGFHQIFATLLFLTLSYFCLFLFQLSAGHPTREKRIRNRVYTVCGWAILISIASIALLRAVGVTLLPGGMGVMFIFESTSLLAFGVAWLVKGETILKDAVVKLPQKPNHDRAVIA